MKLCVIQCTRVSYFFISLRRHERVGMLNLLCLFLAQRTLKCRMILKMTQFSWLSVHQILWQCAILNLLVSNTCLRHWLLQYLYSDMDLVYNCKHSKDKISTLVILRDAVHLTKFNRFRCYCLMCNHVFRFSSKQLREERRIYGDLLLVTAARKEGPS